ncbi:protein phosphatase 1 regulatory subunit 3C-B-like [Cololabis saira]|uniref:protein phosphatase 1 regulatory subunit 3C-B-like n=1 Tax=Cololabis saira TaxID=129043 RepID=UPI002AD1E31B|nr:protein phosphatase 1 regulatory subunit 3C-B-like [Cololabis saira]
MAVRICLASSPPLRSFVGNRSDGRPTAPGALPQFCRPQRPCLSVVSVATKASTEAAAEESRGKSQMVLRMKRERKSVVFADSWGLALTTVHVFNEAEDDLLTELQLHLREMEGAAAGLQLADVRDSTDSGSSLVLDFTPPAEDYLDLRNRLKAQQVSLETCSVQERLLSGTVQVRNICFEKSVWVRITFDSWRSFQDVGCVYLNNVYGCPDTDTFSFSVSVPEDPGTSDRVEFCVRYQTRHQTFWDNNLGENYQLVSVDPSRIPETASGLEIQRGRGGGKMDFDPFGSPRMSSGIFPEWQSWGHVETSAPYW